MKRLKEIKLMVQTAQDEWLEIEQEIAKGGSPRGKVGFKMEGLKNLLEDIRVNIESSLVYSRCSMLVKVCRAFLESIFTISENLRVSYMFPGYVESYYIMDTMKFADVEH